MDMGALDGRRDGARGRHSDAGHRGHGVRRPGRAARRRAPDPVVLPGRRSSASRATSTSDLCPRRSSCGARRASRRRRSGLGPCGEIRGGGRRRDGPGAGYSRGPDDPGPSTQGAIGAYPSSSSRRGRGRSHAGLDRRPTARRSAQRPDPPTEGAEADRPRPGTTSLVTGASGAVAAFAAQFAVQLGLRVIAQVAATTRTSARSLAVEDVLLRRRPHGHRRGRQRARRSPGRPGAATRTAAGGPPCSRAESRTAPEG